MSDAGPIVSGEEVDLALDDDDLVAGVVVIAKVVQPDGSVAVSIGSSASMSWLDQLGLVTAAGDIIRQPGYEGTGGDE